MRYHHFGFQIQARRIAENLPQSNGRQYRDLRAENARRQAAALTASLRGRP